MAESIKTFYYKNNQGALMRFVSHHLLRTVREDFRRTFENRRELAHAPATAILQVIQGGKK